jgi:predicted nucleic-acid-binding protein
MIGLDTNLLVRFFMQDDVVQTAAVSRLFSTLHAKNPGFVSLVVLVELHWVLERFYKVDRESRLVITESLLSADQLKIESSPLVRQALAVAKTSAADFPDCLIAKFDESAGCDTVFTFDKAAAKHAGMSLLK